jgi:hypothetical protein
MHLASALEYRNFKAEHKEGLFSVYLGLIYLSVALTAVLLFI